MRFFNLLESNYVDLYSKILKDFISDNKNEYNNDVFVHFTNNRDIAFSNAFETNSDWGMVCIPKTYFTNHPIIYKNEIQRYFRVLEPQKPLLKINEVSHSSFKKYCKTLKVDNPDEVYSKIMKETNYFNKKSSYGYVLYYILSHEIKNKEVTSTKDTSSIKSKLINLGFYGVYDTSKSITSAILSRQYPCICYIFKNGAVNTKESFDTFRKEKTENDDENDNYELFKKLASYISVSLNSGLNSDEPYHEGLDHYYWTYDGFQIRITIIYETNTDDKDSDDIAYQLDIETPFGTIYIMTSPEDTFDNIAKNVSNRYSKMTTPVPDWKPKDRDIFLVNHFEDYKDNNSKIQDIINEVRKYYPAMFSFGIVYNIEIPRLETYSDFDKSFLSGIIETFSNQPSARKFIEKISKDGEITDTEQLKKYFPRSKLPRQMTYDILKKMALIYDIARKKRPNVTGWRLFREF